METYRAFGLSIASDVPLPELREARDGYDVRIRLGRVDTRTDANPPDGTGIQIRKTPAGTSLANEQLGQVLVSEGTTITVSPKPETTVEDLSQFLVGPALRVLLHQRGALVLHASAVAVDGEAVAFTGPSGAGKSTAAAACYADGYGLVADDIVALRRDGDGLVVPPGFPRSKLGDSAANALDLPTVDDHDSAGRSYYSAESRFPDEPLSLAQLYVLDDSADLRIEPLSSGEAMYLLARDSYSSRGTDASDDRTHFERCAEVTSQTTVRRLCRPRSLDRLGEFVELVERNH